MSICFGDERDADKALATLFAAGAFAPKADAAADAIKACCADALEGLSGAKEPKEETAVLNAALDKLRGQ